MEIPTEIVDAYPEAFSEDAYMWQYVVTLSYAFTYYKSTFHDLFDLPAVPESEDFTGFLIYPAISLVNHGNFVEKPGNDYTKPSGTLYYKKPGPHFKMQTQKPFRKGEEILFSYGDKSNIDLLFFYGFVIQRNPFDYFNIMIEKSDIPCHEDSKENDDGSCKFYVYPSEACKEAIEHLLRYYYQDPNVKYTSERYENAMRDESSEKYFYAAFLNYRFFVRDIIEK
jgi:hypothetical protein